MSDKDKKIEKLKQKVKKYKLLYTMAQKDLRELVERTPSKFLSKDSDYSKPEWTPKQIEYWDKMIKQSIKDTTARSNERTDEWRIEQFNRHRDAEHQVRTIKELKDKVSELFTKKYIYESPDGGKTLYRREMNNYDTKEKINE